MEKYTAIYVRRSVSDSDKGNNSLSINAQKEECIRYLGDDTNFKVYCDDGKSGKDIEHRPEFMQMMADARDGLIGQIIVKKYDRFSRNMREYLNITNELDKYGVPVFSLSEPFNTGTKEGRMMRNNLLNFAEFERETIAARVKDAYHTKAMETGFYQGGKVYFGFQSERRTINGKTGSVLVPSPLSQTVQAIYDVYKEPGASLKDVADYIAANDLPVKVFDDPSKQNKRMDRSHISRILRNPLYVRADENVYAFFLSKGYEVIDDIESFDGVHGLLWHKYGVEHNFIKVSYHEGLIDAETWLAVQMKLAGNHQIPQTRKGDYKTWLVGLTKCAHCGRAITVTHSYNVDRTKVWRYYSCTGYNTVQGCVKLRPELRPDDVEALVFEKMKEHIEEIQIIKSEKNKDSEIIKLRTEIMRIESDSKKLIERLTDADDVLFKYIQDKINELHNQKTELEQKLVLLERRIKKIDLKPLEEPLKNWDSLTNEERHAAAVLIIDRIDMSDETGIDIHFAF